MLLLAVASAACRRARRSPGRSGPAPRGSPSARASRARCRRSRGTRGRRRVTSCPARARAAGSARPICRRPSGSAPGPASARRSRTRARSRTSRSAAIRSTLNSWTLAISALPVTRSSSASAIAAFSPSSVAGVLSSVSMPALSRSARYWPIGSGGGCAAARPGRPSAAVSASRKRIRASLLRFDLDLDLRLVLGQVAVVVRRDLDGGALAVGDVDDEAVLDLVAEALVSPSRSSCRGGPRGGRSRRACPA